MKVGRTEYHARKRDVRPAEPASRTGDREESGERSRGGGTLLPAAPEGSGPYRRPAAPAMSAPLMAQLIATKLALPQTRRLRRAEPRFALDAYEAAGGLGAAAGTGRTFKI